MAVVIGGRRNQEWINRGARERAFSRFTGTGFFVVLGALVFQTLAMVYVASLPRERAVVIAQQRDGSYQPYAASASPDEPGKLKLLADWTAAWRLGGAVPIAARQTAALLTTNDDVERQVKAYNQELADSGSRVEPVIRSATCAAYDCEVAWDETVTAGTTRTQRAMKAYVTVAFDDPHVNLHNDPLTNPYGMFVRALRIVEVGRK